MTRRPVTKPKQAMSAREVDRMEKELKGIGQQTWNTFLRIARLVNMVRRSERR